MQILNLYHRELCGRYASYRVRQRPPAVRRQDEDQPETVRDDILACIYAAAWYGRRTRLLPEVYLLPLFSPEVPTSTAAAIRVVTCGGGGVALGWTGAARCWLRGFAGTQTQEGTRRRG